MTKKLDQKFYRRANVVQIAKDLLGKVLLTDVDGHFTAGKIVETEAYSYREKACHAHNKRHTTRTNKMFLEGGHAYVYLIYGMYELFNIVTNEDQVPEAVLIRAVEPLEGVDIMHERRQTTYKNLTSGPGKLTIAMGITRNLNGIALTGKRIWLEDHGNKLEENQIVTSTRIGVDYAGEDALLPWRFYEKGHSFVSKK